MMLHTYFVSRLLLGDTRNSLKRGQSSINGEFLFPSLSPGFSFNKFGAVRSSVSSKSKETTGMYNEPLNMIQLHVFFSLLSLAALRLESGILHVSPRPGLVKLLWLSRLRHYCFTARLFKGLSLLFRCLILLALRPPVPSWSGTSRRGFVHLTLVPFPDFIPQSFDALAHEFDLRHARIFH